MNQMDTILIIVLIAIVLLSFYYLQKLIKMTQEEAAAKLNEVNQQLIKAKQEIIDALAKQPNVIPELQDAVNSLVGVSQELDDLHPDVIDPVEPEEPETSEEPEV